MSGHASMTNHKDDNTSEERLRAPALVKGLEILELLAANTLPFTLSAISEKLGRSRSEIFRMVHDLETLGYIRRSLADDGYEITNKLFTLGFEQPRVTTLLEAALPEMRRYARSEQQSCHIAIQFDEQFVVIARIESPAPTSFAVRVGHRRILHASTSGIILYAFQPEDVQKEWLELMKRADASIDEAMLESQAEKAREDGYFARESDFVRGVTDIGAPIMRNGRAIASFTSPCIGQIKKTSAQQLPVDAVLETAARISRDVAPI